MRKSINMVAVGMLLLLAVVSPAFAGINDMVTQFQDKANNLASQMVSSGVQLLSILFLINFFLNHWRLMFTGEWPQIFTKLLGSLMWGSFLLWMVKSPSDPLNMIFNVFVSLAGAGGGAMDPDQVMQTGLDLINNLYAGWSEQTGSTGGMLGAVASFDLSQVAKNLGVSLSLVFTSIMVLIAYGLLTLAVVMAKMEFYMVLIVAPISFALGGLDALKDTGIAPLKSALSMGYRILIISIIATIAKSMAPKWSDGFKTMTVDNWDPVFAPVIGMIIIVGMTFSAGKIAAALASGSAALSGNDALSGAMKAASIAGGAAAAAGMSLGMLGAGLAKGLGVANSPGAIGKAMGQALSGLANPSASNASSKTSPGGSATGASAADQQKNQDIVSSMDGGAPSGADSSGGADPGAPASPAPAGNATDAGIGGGAPSAGTGGAPGASASDQASEEKKAKRLKAQERKDAMRKAFQAASDENNASVSVNVNTNVHNH